MKQHSKGHVCIHDLHTVDFPTQHAPYLARTKHNRSKFISVQFMSRSWVLIYTLWAFPKKGPHLTTFILRWLKRIRNCYRTRLLYAMCQSEEAYQHRRTNCGCLTSSHRKHNCRVSKGKEFCSASHWTARNVCRSNFAFCPVQVDIVSFGGFSKRPELKEWRESMCHQSTEILNQCNVSFCLCR